MIAQDAFAPAVGERSFCGKCRKMRLCAQVVGGTSLCRKCLGGKGDGVAVPTTEEPPAEPTPPPAEPYVQVAAAEALMLLPHNARIIMDQKTVLVLVREQRKPIPRWIDSLLALAFSREQDFVPPKDDQPFDVAYKATWPAISERVPKPVRAVPAPSSPVAKTLRVWIYAEAWDALTDEQREDLEEPIGGTKVEWDGREGWITALVSDDEVLVNVRGAVEIYGVTLHVGDEQPVIAAKPRKAPRAKAPKPAKAAKVVKAKPHRLTPEPGADELAQRGMHIYAVLVDGDWTRIERRPKELAADWTERARTEAAQDARVRLYDGSPRCVWDSLDGGSP